jgi:hypothetical protein
MLSLSRVKHGVGGSKAASKHLSTAACIMYTVRCVLSKAAACVCGEALLGMRMRMRMRMCAGSLFRLPNQHTLSLTHTLYLLVSMYARGGGIRGDEHMPVQAASGRKRMRRAGGWRWMTRRVVKWCAASGGQDGAVNAKARGQDRALKGFRCLRRAVRRALALLAPAALPPTRRLLPSVRIRILEEV